MRFLLLLLLPIIISFWGCSQSFDPYSVRIDSVSALNVKAGDTLTINGINFGINFDPCREYIIFNSDKNRQFRYGDYEVIEWTFSRITVIIGKHAETGRMCVYNLGEYSNTVSIEVQPGSR